jgi:predicted ATP-binding protein involved in virulence
MIKIKSLHLENYCGYKEADFDFSKDGKIKNLAIFYGPNGHGKSTMLDAIYMLGNAHSIAGRWNFEKENNLDAARNFQKYVYHKDYNLTYANFDQSQRNTMVISGVLVNKGIEYPVSISTKDGVKTGNLPKDITEAFYYIDADHPNEMSRFQLHAEEEKRFLDLATKIYGFPCFLENKIDAIWADKGKEEFFTNFVIEKTQKDGEKIRVHYKRMSDGEKKISALFRNLCDPNYNYKDAILVDNVEMHIYFKRHALLIDKLLTSFPNKQFITTTHSGSLISHVLDKYGKDFLYDLEDYK